MITVYKIEDTGKSLIHLSCGTYEISFNGETTVVSNPTWNTNKEIEVEGVDQIVELTENSICSHYEDSDGNKISKEEYLTERDKFTVEAKSNEYDEYGWKFEDLDLEYEFKKFMRRWSRISRTVVTRSDPLPFEILSARFETNNQFIVSGLSYCNDDPTIFYFEKLPAALHIVSETFSELGMSFRESLGYEATRGKKVWSNSTHSGIRYVVAFGTYVFDDSFDFRRNSRSRGPLEKLTKEYEYLRKRIRDRIISNYKFHFKTITETESIKLLQDSLSALKTIQNKFVGMDCKVKEQDRYHQIVSYLRESIEKIENKIVNS